MNFKEMLASQARARIFLYGPAKSKKTWWAGMCAELGMNVIILDSDSGWQILANLSEKAQERITVVDISDKINAPTACVFLTMLFKGTKFFWEPKEGKSALTKSALKQDRGYFHIDISKLGPNDVIVFDSHTANTESILFQYMKENAIDPSDAKKTEWEGYRWAGAVSTWMMQQLDALPCHVIVIGHQQNYEKRSKDQKEILWSRIQPKSVSGNHSMTLAKYFTDVLYFEQVGKTIRINTEASGDRDGGTRIFPPGRFDWDKCLFNVWLEKAGITLPTDIPQQEAFRWLEPGEVPMDETKTIGAIAGGKKENTATINLANSPTPPTEKPNPLAKLLGKNG